MALEDVIAETIRAACERSKDHKAGGRALQPVTVTTCGRICFDHRKINLSQVFTGQTVGIRQVDDHLWLVSFMHDDLGYIDDETCRLEPIDNLFGPKLLPMSPV